MLAFYGTALLITLGAILAFTIGIGMLVALPRSLTLIGLPLRDAVPLHAASFLLLLASVVLAIGTLHRYGPARPPADWRLLSTGALTNTSLWAAASFAFSFHVSHFVAYDTQDGALGAAIVLLTWLYLTVYLILLGAELDAAVARLHPRPDPDSLTAR